MIGSEYVASVMDRRSDFLFLRNVVLSPPVEVEEVNGPLCDRGVNGAISFPVARENNWILLSSAAGWFLLVFIQVK